MKQVLLPLMLLSAIHFYTVGCTNAIYYYQNERISLTLEARPDSTQPVQGNLGLKQRIAIITPGKENTPNGTGGQKNTQSKSSAANEASTKREVEIVDGTGPGEALSLVSSFRFKKETGGVLDLGPVTIQAGFVTGDAATNLNRVEATEVVKALTPKGVPTYDSLAKNSILIAAKSNEFDTFKLLTDKRWKDLTSDNRKKLGELSGALSNYNEKLHSAIQQQLKR